MSRKRQDRFFKTTIAVLCLCAVGLIAAIALQSVLDKPSDVTALKPVDGITATDAPMTVISPDSQLRPDKQELTEILVTASPSPVPTVEPFEYLPVYKKINTAEKVIAITVDDCSDIESLKYAAMAAHENEAKLTLLPVASHVLMEENRTALQYCVFTLGYQVENRTLNNSSLYNLSDFELANEVWTADMAIDYALDMDYSMHLLRTKGGQGTQDPRTHAYLKQLGYDGFLNWSVEATRYTADELKASLEPGGIYLFNCTQSEVIKLAEFISFAKSLGYRMVTVNELLGFEENSCVPAQEDILSRTIVELEGFEAQNVEYSDGDRAYGVFHLQQMLYELGYLTINANDAALPEPTLYLDSVAQQQKLVDGVFGAGTRAAILAFQAERGMPCTGIATPEIQAMIQEEYNRRFG